jgi:hypothetical protein
MPRRRQDLLGKLADPFEEALQRFGNMPGSSQFVKAATGLRDRVDDLQKRMGRIDELDKRVRALEKRVDQMAAGTGRSSARRSTTGAAAKRSSTPKSGGTGRSSGGGTTRRRSSS